MSGKKLITVFGATGAQGGGVVSMFLTDPKLNQTWAVRGVTRDASKDSAKRLAERGVEIVTVGRHVSSTLTKAAAQLVFSIGRSRRQGIASQSHGGVLRRVWCYKLLGVHQRGPGDQAGEELSGCCKG